MAKLREKRKKKTDLTGTLEKREFLTLMATPLKDTSRLLVMMTGQALPS